MSNDKDETKKSSRWWNRLFSDSENTVMPETESEPQLKLSSYSGASSTATTCRTSTSDPSLMECVRRITRNTNGQTETTEEKFTKPVGGPREPRTDDWIDSRSIEVPVVPSIPVLNFDEELRNFFKDDPFFNQLVAENNVKYPFKFTMHSPFLDSFFENEWNDAPFFGSFQNHRTKQEETLGPDILSIRAGSSVSPKCNPSCSQTRRSTIANQATRPLLLAN